VRELAALGVDEIACLVDFGVPADVVLESLAHLDELRALAASGAVDRTGGDYSIHAQIERHGVTHMQCTPTLVGLVADDPAGAKALGSLKTLLLGGEALPTSLVSRLLPVVKGRVFNMYGPTETTVWSTCAEVAREVGADITIGRPIANTQVYVVNRGLRPVPVGVPGELLIGGDGVSAGYLNRAELTRERFVPDTLSGRGDGLLYRTGDLARWRSDGTLEFLGRLDHQVKIRGFRIELGEIEKVLSTHPAVHEAVVVAGNDGRNEQRLVAYVRLREQVAAGADDATAYWKTIWDETYEASGTTGDAAPQLDTTGWHSSYTSQPIDDEHMKAWVAETTSRVAALAPRRVLDVGCGTGLVLFRIAPRCERYVGVDTSPAALRRLRARVDAAGLDGIVSLEELSADALEQLGDGRFDTIVLNSVAQYFPDVGHFVRVVEKAWNLLDSGGHLFVGDVRSLPLLAAFHGSVALQDAPAALPAEELRRRVERQVAAERELVLDPGIFHALDSTLRDLAGVEIRLKHDAAHLNEMTRFRYDVVLSKSREGQAPACQPETLEAPDACSIEALGALLRDAPPCVRIVGIPNARIRDDFRAVEMLARGEGGTTTGELRSTVRALPGKGLDPGAVLDLDPGYEIFATDSAAGADRFDLIARRRTEGARVAPLAPIPASEHRPWTAYANTPARAFSRQSLVGELRAHLRAKLPEFMVPSAFVALETFPQTPNGKVDRKRLPAPDQPTGDRGTTYAAPANETEKTIAAVWQEILTLERVSVEQNFFDLGANSLMMVQAHGRLRQALGRQIALVDLFRFPTVRALAAQLSGAAPGVDVLRRSQERALSRRDAMSRRRDVRDGARAKD
jgi:SAM-dependent methyltransferase/acyl carrier protein